MLAVHTMQVHHKGPCRLITGKRMGEGRRKETEGKRVMRMMWVMMKKEKKKEKGRGEMAMQPRHARTHRHNNNNKSITSALSSFLLPPLSTFPSRISPRADEAITFALQPKGREKQGHRMLEQNDVSLRKCLPSCCKHTLG